MAARRRKTAKTGAGAMARRLASVPRLSQALARLEKQLPKELRAPLATWRRQVATWEARLDRLRADRDARFAHFDAQMRRDAKRLLSRVEGALAGLRRRPARKARRRPARRKTAPTT
jgi:hypothetical protein